MIALGLGCQAVESIKKDAGNQEFLKDVLPIRD